jgi:hypothetical protein
VTEVIAAPAADVRTPGLAARLAGVLFSPRATYGAIVAQPKVFGALAVTMVVTAAIQFAFLSTTVGQDALFDRQLSAIERFGGQPSPQMIQGLEAGLPRARYTTAASILVFGPLTGAAVAGLLLWICNAFFDGDARFKQVYAIGAHAGIITVLQQLFATPINFAKGEMGAPASLGVFLPMLDPDGFLGGFLGFIDLFIVWVIISQAIGLGVLYKRRTGPIALSLLSVYVVIALAVALIF